MFDFIKLMYQDGKISAEKVKSYVPKFITEEESEIIIG